MHFHLPSLLQHQASPSDFEQLEIPFTEEEINEVVKQLPPDKSPGPDGFNNEFFKSCWDIIKPDVTRLIHEFYAGKISLESINTSFITLVPKGPSPSTANDFRPISLLNCCLKLITKIACKQVTESDPQNGSYKLVWLP